MNYCILCLVAGCFVAGMVDMLTAVASTGFFDVDCQPKKKSQIDLFSTNIQNSKK